MSKKKSNSTNERKYVFECSRYEALKGIKDFTMNDELFPSGIEFGTLSGTYNLESDKIVIKGDKFEYFDCTFHILLWLYYDFNRLYNLFYEDEKSTGIRWQVLDVLDEIVSSIGDEFKSIFSMYDYIFADKSDEDDSNTCCKTCEKKNSCSLYDECLYGEEDSE